MAISSLRSNAIIMRSNRAAGSGLHGKFYTGCYERARISILDKKPNAKHGQLGRNQLHQKDLAVSTLPQISHVSSDSRAMRWIEMCRHNIMIVSNPCMLYCTQLLTCTGTVVMLTHARSVVTSPTATCAITMESG